MDDSFHNAADVPTFGPSLGSSGISKDDLARVFPGVPLEPEVLKALAEQRKVDPEIWQS